MTKKLATFFVTTFGFLTTTIFGKYILVFIISMLPIIELRGGLIAASILDLPPLQSYLVCIAGNIIPIPFILWFITPIFDYLKGTVFKKMVHKIEHKAHKKKGQIENLKYIGLWIFVAIPLPGTGGWTGALIAALLDMDKKKSLIAISAGILTAGIIMLIVSYLVLGGIL